MPTLYTESDFTAGRFDDKQISVGTNYGLSITNFSDQGFQATVQRTGEIYVLPPYSLYTFPVQPNDSVIIQHLATNYNATKIGDRYLRYDQVANTVEPKLIPLSAFPVYNQEITGNVNVLGGTVNANITSGTVTANISNASINTQLLNSFIRNSNGVVMLKKQYTMSNRSANQRFVLLDELLSDVYFINKIAILFSSSSGITYTITGELRYQTTSLIDGYTAITNIPSVQITPTIHDFPSFINIPLVAVSRLIGWCTPATAVTSDTIEITYIGVMDAAQNGVQATSASIYTLPNASYYTIFQPSKPVIVRGIFLGTSVSTTGQFRIDKNGNSGTPFLSLNTGVQSQYYPINPGYYLAPGETLQAYQATGNTINLNCTIYYT